MSVILNDKLGKNYFNAFIDNDRDNPIIIDCESGTKVYSIAKKLDEGPHTITLTKRTDGREGNTIFQGFILDDNAKLITPPIRPIRPIRRIEFYGDSITSGLGNEATISSGDKNIAEKNHYLSYAALTARALSAEHTSISLSGIGLMVSWFDWTMHDYYDQIDGTGPDGKTWNFNQWTPDVVVINLMQNDSWLVDSRLNPIPTTEQRIKAYYDFIDTIRGRYHDAQIIATLGSMDAAKAGSQWPGYITQAISQYRRDHHDQKIDSLFFDYTGFNKHPRVLGG